MSEQITAHEFHEAEGVEEWRVLGDGACTFFGTGSFAASARFVAAISAVPGIDGEGPDIDVRPGGVTVRLITITDDAFGMTRRDVELARRISAVAREQGLTGDPSAVQSVLFVIEAIVNREVMPFWRAVLGYVPRGDNPDEDLVDPQARWPAVWFETMLEPRPVRNGIHIAVWVPPEQAEARVAAAVAAGGRVTSDAHAPSWWTLADADGNEADIATIAGRD